MSGGPRNFHRILSQQYGAWYEISWGASSNPNRACLLDHHICLIVVLLWSSHLEYLCEMGYESRYCQFCWKIYASLASKTENKYYFGKKYSHTHVSLFIYISSCRFHFQRWQFAQRLRQNKLSSILQTFITEYLEKRISQRMSKTTKIYNLL